LDPKGYGSHPPSVQNVKILSLCTQLTSPIYCPLFPVDAFIGEGKVLVKISESRWEDNTKMNPKYGRTEMYTFDSVGGLPKGVWEQCHETLG
jgi:hypothetical protein